MTALTLHASAISAVFALFACAWLGCEQSSTPPSVRADPAAKPAPSVPSAPPPPPPPAPGKWTCAVDADCRNSCSQGAVSKAWYAQAEVQECKDGCAGKISAAPQCIDGSCVAFARDLDHPGKFIRSEECTHRP